MKEVKAKIYTPMTPLLYVGIPRSTPLFVFSEVSKGLVDDATNGQARMAVIEPNKHRDTLKPLLVDAAHCLTRPPPHVLPC